MKPPCSFRGSICTLAIIFVSVGALKAQITATPAPDANGKIAFLSTRDGTDEIYVMEADGANPTRLTHFPSYPFPTLHEPAVSPDGTKIVFTRLMVADYTGYDIWVMNADGSQPVQLTNTQGDDYEPDWSPDGTKIVFSSRRVGNYEIYVMNADGSNPINLTNSPSNDHNPAWSPDGRKIAFDNDRLDIGHVEVYVMNADGSNQVALTSMTYNKDPAWSPDGTKIAFATMQHGGYDIYIMNADGSNQTWLTSNYPGQDSAFPSWSTDGAKIAFCAGQPFEIYSINIDGSNRTNLTNNFGTDVAPNWQKRLPAPPPPPAPSPTVGPAWTATPNPHGKR